VAKAPSTDQALRAIRAIRDTPESFDLKRDLAPFLKHKSNHVAAAAASTAERLEAVALAPDLVEAFLELMKDPAKCDPGCEALIAIAKALVAMDDPAAKVYFAGVHHVQMEGSFGPPIDAAAPLRGLCAQGLARMGHPGALIECVNLLVDKEVPARVGATRAIADSGDIAGTLLLRLKALLGDKEDEVIGECFSGLLRLAPGPSLEFVAGFLSSRSDEIAEAAAFALAESHTQAAFPLLRKAWDETAQAERKRALLHAVALLRLDEALEFLLARVAEDREAAAGDALSALALYSRDESVRKRVEEIVGKRASSVLKGVFEREFRS
jgi:HEAT repeat protein